MKKTRKGFTLIELLVVILILAVLAALIVPRVIQRGSDAKRAKAASDIATLSSSLQQFYLDNGRFPSSEEGLEALRFQPVDAPNWRGPYLDRAIPPDPWGYDYIYEWPGQDGEDTYILLSYGSDGQPGGEGEASDIIHGLD
jgi:general secretion pathway protein G